jgi:hypothetical protein
MITLIFVTCALSGADCHQTRVATNFSTPTACLMATAQLLPKWLQDNYDRVYVRSICEELRA